MVSSAASASSNLLQIPLQDDSAAAVCGKEEKSVINRHVVDPKYNKTINQLTTIAIPTLACFSAAIALNYLEVNSLKIGLFSVDNPVFVAIASVMLAIIVFQKYQIDNLQETIKNRNQEVLSKDKHIAETSESIKSSIDIVKEMMDRMKA